jgi:hypothetical protein
LRVPFIEKIWHMPRSTAVIRYSIKKILRGSQSPKGVSKTAMSGGRINEMRRSKLIDTSQPLHGCAVKQ